MNWNELQATDDYRLTSTLWNANYVGLNDVDAKSGYESTTLFQQDYPKWKDWNLTNLTQKWANGTATNYGVVLWATNETTDGYDLRFYSSEYTTDPTLQPKLEITYSTDAATKTVYFLKDHLGSIRATVLDSATAPVRGYDDYDPWGYPLALRTKPIPNAYLQGASKNKFTGKEYDDELGLNLGYFGARYYDWVIGRFLAIDPLTNKYPSLSPYNYVANNPLLLIDPNGKEIWILYDKERIKYENGKLYNADGSLYAGKGVKKDGTYKGFLGQAVNALNNIGQSSEAASMLSELQSSKNVFTIQKASKSEFKPDNVLNAYANQRLEMGQALTGMDLTGGSGGTINWNPSGNPIWEVGGQQKTRSFVDLAHEMFHGLDANRGLLDDRLYPDNGIKRSEWQAVYRYPFGEPHLSFHA